MRLRLVPLLLLSACGTRGLPAHSSPTPEPVADGPSIGSVIDAVASEPTWWDAASGRVLRLEGTETVVVRDEVLPEPYRLRVLDDDTIVIYQPGLGLTVWPVGASAISIPDTSAEFDGVDLGSLWFYAWGATSDDLSLCRLLPDGRECVETLTFPYGPGPLGVDSDGSVYVTGSVRIARWDGTALRPLGGGETDQMLGFRHGVGPGLLLVGYAAVYGVSAAGVEELWPFDGDRTLVAGSPDHFVVGTRFRETSRSCGGDWFGTPCSTREIWSQWVFTDVVGGVAREIGHESCVQAESATMPSCAWTTEALSLGAGDVTLVGAPLRRLAR